MTFLTNFHFAPGAVNVPFTSSKRGVELAFCARCLNKNYKYKSLTIKRYLFRLRILSACGLLMYCSTICFHRRRQSQPRKKLWTFLIFCISLLFSAIPRKLLCSMESGSGIACMLLATSPVAEVCTKLLLIVCVYWYALRPEDPQALVMLGRSSFFKAHSCRVRKIEKRSLSNKNI